MVEQRLHRVASSYLVWVYCLVQQSLFPRVPDINSSTELEKEGSPPRNDFCTAQQLLETHVRAAENINILRALDCDLPN